MVAIRLCKTGSSAVFNLNSAILCGAMARFSEWSIVSSAQTTPVSWRDNSVVFRYARLRASAIHNSSPFLYCTSKALTNHQNSTVINEYKNRLLILNNQQSSKTQSVDPARNMTLLSHSIWLRNHTTQNSWLRARGRVRQHRDTSFIQSTPALLRRSKPNLNVAKKIR